MSESVDDYLLEQECMWHMLVAAQEEVAQVERFGTWQDAGIKPTEEQSRSCLFIEGTFPTMSDDGEFTLFSGVGYGFYNPQHDYYHDCEDAVIEARRWLLPTVPPEIIEAARRSMAERAKRWAYVIGGP